MLWIILFFLTPAILLVASSFWTQDGVRIDRTFTLSNYATALAPGSLEVRILIRSLLIGVLTCALSVIVAAPFAYYVAKVVKSPRAKGLLLLPVLLPFLVSPLVVTVAWRGVLGTRGLVNTALMGSGLIHQALGFLLFSNFAVVLALVYNYSLWMFFTLYISLEALDDDLIAAARDLGATRSQSLRLIVLPLSVPGLATGLVLTFVPVIGAVLEPEVLGGTGGRLIGNSIRDWFLGGLDWPFGATLGVILMTVTLVILAAALWITARRFRRSVTSR